MIKLNDSSIFVGQIKQLLHTFNLPTCQIGNAYPAANKHFITKDNLYLWELDENNNLIAKKQLNYVFGAEYQNITDTLPIRNMLYDRETHRYLGRYLRFLRDYSGINLMSMYNCCDGEIYLQPFSIDINGKDISFTNDPNGSAVYKVPVSISPLTFSTHGTNLIEACVFVDNTNTEFADIIKAIAERTYVKRKPQDYFTYNPFAAITDPAMKTFIWKHLNELCILVKVSSALNTSLVVLEGTFKSKNYQDQRYLIYKPTITETSDVADTSLWAILSTSIALAQSGIDINTASPDDYVQLYSSDSGVPLLVKAAAGAIAADSVDSGFSIASQLLSTENTSGSYLLGDRLFEYLSDNVITPLSESYEIKRVQNALNSLRPRNNAQITNTYLKEYQNKYGNVISYRNAPKAASRGIPRHYGIWHSSDLQDLRSIAVKSELILNHDELGYLDKTLETAIKGVIDNVNI